tara:strand:- start:349 stop:1143 length:795 start_codon:yes stop_codon:yes gene_type:complete
MIALKIQNLSKRYQLGVVTAQTISMDINRWWSKIRGKVDPASEVTSENILMRENSSKYVWALNDINFEVNQGERIGIIGKNGSGKSTLLKIISRITSPTKGLIKINGTVGSLLEVGTGFDGELTGLENIYLYGSILGMTTNVINNNLEKIIKFSGIESYINTPLKRYSSGMRIRLGFAVTSFLDADILILDEVFAVGDQKFQEEAMNKIKELATEQNRTILFVSHNLETIKKNTNRCIILDNGSLLDHGNTADMINKYLKHINE